MDKIETRQKLIQQAIKMGIPKALLKNLTSRSIRKIVEHEEQVERNKHGTGEIPGYRA